MFLKILLVLLVSMVPLIELRGAIPIAIAMGIDLPEWAVLLIAIIGNIIPVPFIYFFARRILEWMAKSSWKPLRKAGKFFLKKGEKAGSKLLEKVHSGLYVALYLFVAIPFPGTGAWTGTLAASILNLDFKKSIVAIISGVVTAGVIMLLISLGLFRVIFG